MADKSLSTLTRKEEVREKNEVVYATVQFELDQIKQHFYDSLDDIKKQFSVADTLVTQGRVTEAKDIWRSQIVFLEGILDFYIHELSKYALIKIFTGKWPKSKTYEGFQIPMITVEEGLKYPESTTWLLQRLSTRFSTETYLNPEQLGKQLSLIGMTLDKICKRAYPKVAGQSYLTGQKRLKLLFNRRNQIVHQADRHHANAEKDDIDQEFVNKSIDFIVRFVEAIHDEALTKDL